MSESIKIAHFSEIFEHEAEILKRIGDLPQGGNLFMAHPLRCLEDVGVELSRSAHNELLRHEPHLAGLSDAPYEALRQTDELQSVRFHLGGLFRPPAKHADRSSHAATSGAVQGSGR
jgi:hypothetical protein